MKKKNLISISAILLTWVPVVIYFNASIENNDLLKYERYKKINIKETFYKSTEKYNLELYIDPFSFRKINIDVENFALDKQEVREGYSVHSKATSVKFISVLNEQGLIVLERPEVFTNMDLSIMLSEDGPKDFLGPIRNCLEDYKRLSLQERSSKQLKVTILGLARERLYDLPRIKYVNNILTPLKIEINELEKRIHSGDVELNEKMQKDLTRLQRQYIRRFERFESLMTSDEENKYRVLKKDNLFISDKVSDSYECSIADKFLPKKILELRKQEKDQEYDLSKISLD